MEKWSSEQKWDVEWEFLDKIGRGGQGTTKKVVKKHAQEVACLKELNNQKDPERRARFLREATAYATCDHPGIPRLVQSNAHRYEDQVARLFILTDFIPGKTLADFIGAGGPTTLEEAATTIIKLLDIADYFHSLGWTHRDVKPDNIILRDDRPSDPVVVDFGLAYKDGVTEKFQTDDGQGLDNRFLRLPELSVNSRQKQDLRTDLAFFGGILMYMITGVTPGTLVDESGRTPHQRAEVISRVREVGGNATRHLLNFFDHTFAQKISERFASAIEMKQALEAVLVEKEKKVVDSVDNDLRAIKAALDSQANKQLVRNKGLYDAAMMEITMVHRIVGNEVGPIFQSYQTGYTNFEQKFQNVLGFAHFSNHDKRFTPHFEMTIEGEELVITVDGTAFYRTDVDEPAFDQDFRDRLRQLYITGVSSLLAV
ncbi:serine/threonine protein kinase [Burkholderia pseudomallei]|nr:serine/threonine protein kinase [Burkholderia pseudomallei]